VEEIIMQLEKFLDVNNIRQVQEKALEFGKLYNQNGEKILQNIYDALKQVNASDELIKKILTNSYTWHELVEQPLDELLDFVDNNKLDESGLWSWLVTD
jgi:hypothetical protein